MKDTVRKARLAVSTILQLFIQLLFDMIEVPDSVKKSATYKNKEKYILSKPVSFNPNKGRKRGLSVNCQVDFYKTLQFRSNLTKIDEYEEAADEFGVLDAQKYSTYNNVV